MVDNAGSMHTHLFNLIATRYSVIEGSVLDHAWKRPYHLDQRLAMYMVLGRLSHCIINAKGLLGQIKKGPLVDFQNAVVSSLSVSIVA